MTEKLSERMLRMAQDGYAAQCGYGPDLREWAGEVAKLEAEAAELRRPPSRKWMCAYCGEVFEQGSMANWHAEVGKHMAGCKKAPIMRLIYATEALKKVSTYARGLRRKLAEARSGQAEQYRAAHEAERQLAEARDERDRWKKRANDLTNAVLKAGCTLHVNCDLDPENDYCVTPNVRDLKRQLAEARAVLEIDRRKWCAVPPNQETDDWTVYGRFDGEFGVEDELGSGSTLLEAVRAAIDAAKEPR